VLIVVVVVERKLKSVERVHIVVVQYKLKLVELVHIVELVELFLELNVDMPLVVVLVNILSADKVHILIPVHTFHVER
jgi:hypothetical protein